MSCFSSFGQFEAWLDGLGLFHMRLGLERMNAALAALDLQRPRFKVIQVLGTNGKGSTAAFLAALASAHGCRAGLFSSPHFISPRERALIDGRQAAENLWLDAANEIMAACGHEPDLTYFEFVTIAALLLFRRENVRLAILEAGLGGANDATTAVDAAVRCITPVAMDHAAVIGPAIEDIARDKAAAIRNAAPVFSAPQFGAVRRILELACARSGAALSFAQPLPKGTVLGLRGAHQSLNAGLALAAWQSMAPGLGANPRAADTQAKALAGAFLPGRMQFWPGDGRFPPLLLDGGHNPHGIMALVKALARLAPETGRGLARPQALIFSCLADKDWRPGLAMLARLFRGRPIFIPQLANARALPAREAAAFCQSMAPDSPCRAFSGGQALCQALEAAARTSPPGGIALLTGSLYLLSEFYALRPGALEKDVHVEI